MAGLIRFLRKFYFAATLIIAILLCCFILLFQNYSHPTDLGNTSKANSRLGLSTISQDSVTIHLVETSGKSYLDAREACSIESAALHHPDRNVTLYSIGILSPNNSYVTVLRNIPNVHLKHLNLSELFRGTPLDEFHHQGSIQNSTYPTEIMSDAVRLALVWKHGGIYLDTDVIVIRSFRGLSNAVALENPLFVNGAVLVFDQYSPFLIQCMTNFAKFFLGLIWGMMGPGLLTLNLMDYCKNIFLIGMVNSPSLCQGVTLLPSDSFYPIASWTNFKLFGPADDVHLDMSQSYAVHLYSNMSKSFVVAPGTNSFIEYLARNNCPLVYENMKKDKAI